MLYITRDLNKINYIRDGIISMDRLTGVDRRRHRKRLPHSQVPSVVPKNIMGTRLNHCKK